MDVEQPTFYTVVQDKKNLLYGVLAGFIISWAVGGMQGDNTGYLCIFSVIIYIVYTRKQTKPPKTLQDAIDEIADMMRPSGVYLDTDPAKVNVRWRGGDLYFFDFLSNHRTFTWEGKLAKGVREISDRTADSLKTERDNMYLDTKAFEIDDLIKK